ncbi:Nose resistant to fluoxetine protein 6 [Aphelenchoides fujianensis]|nr:Nose resistant to fluoxetine protein 6 [Aphelenchoides fujianensis]
MLYYTFFLILSFLISNEAVAMSTVQFLQQHMEYWDPRNLSDLSYLCQLDIERLGEAFDSTNPLNDSTITSKFLDASAKLSPGVLEEVQMSWGSPLECAAIQIGNAEAGESEIIYGRYSRLFINNRVLGLRQSIECFNDGLKSNFMWDLCLPHTCEENDALEIGRQIFRRSEWRPDGFDSTFTPFCYATNEHTNDRQADWRFWIVLAVLCIPALLALVGSIVTYSLESIRDFRKLWLWTFLISFSFHTNCKSIFAVRSARRSGDQLEVLHAMRVVSICWVILGHTCISVRFLADNVDDVRRTKEHWWMEVIYNGYFAVDCFFFISGLLTAYLFLKFEQNPKVLQTPSFWALFFVHRLLRIVPAYFCVLLFKTFVFPLVINGSVQNMGLQSTEDVCLHTWWTNLLFVNNLVGSNAQCLIPAWFVATDLQIFLFAPLLLLPIVWKPLVGVAIVCLGILLSTATHFFTVYSNFYPPAVFLEPTEVSGKATNLDDYNRNVYYASWIRCQVYFVGMLVGVFLRKRGKLHVPRWAAICLWLLAGGSMAACQFGLHGWRNGARWSRAESAFYSAFSRLGWTFGLVVITFSTRFGFAGPLGRLARIKGWIPAARLTYCMYLLHPLVLQYAIFSIRGLVVFKGTFLSAYIPVLVVTFVLSIAWSACFEVSFGNLERLLLGPPARRAATRAHSEENTRL